MGPACGLGRLTEARFGNGGGGRVLPPDGTGGWIFRMTDWLSAETPPRKYYTVELLLTDGEVKLGAWSGVAWISGGREVEVSCWRPLPFDFKSTPRETKSCDAA